VDVFLHIADIARNAWLAFAELLTGPLNQFFAAIAAFCGFVALWKFGQEMADRYLGVYATNSGAIRSARVLIVIGFSVAYGAASWLAVTMLAR